MSNINEKELIKQKFLYLLDKRKIYECTLVATFYKEPTLYFNLYDIGKKVFRNKIWIFYFELGNKLIEKGYQEINAKNILLYLSNYPELKEEYDKKGGYDTIANIIEIADIKNLKMLLEELEKSALLYELLKETSFSIETIDSFLSSRLEDVKNVLSLKFENILSISTSEDKIQRNSLKDGLEEIILEADKGINLGLPLKSPILNYEIGGLRLGNLILIGAGSGSGKTTFTQEVYLSSLWEQEESVVIFINEQDHKKWKQQFLTWIINNIILKDEKTKFNSKRWIQGFFTEEEKNWLYKAKEILEEKTKDNLIQFVEFDKYSMKKLIQEVKKYHKLGVKYFALDTFKLSSDSKDNGDTFWLSMQEDMRALYDIVKPAGLNINFWVTLQLDKISYLKRYITRTDIGMSKNVIDVADAIIFLRNIHNDEYEGKKALQVTNPLSLGEIKSGRKVELIPNENYTIVFLDKNRNGNSGMYQIVARQNLGTLEWEEKGLTKIPFGT